ncbi:hypothetical protein F4811DRAFT_558400 [Daldinia bambusicola]|nr:hypothetical protein F4811DRAFT_558400 [Daldinia bambusicola]
MTVDGIRTTIQKIQQEAVHATEGRVRGLEDRVIQEIEPSNTSRLFKPIVNMCLDEISQLRHHALLITEIDDFEADPTNEENGRVKTVESMSSDEISKHIFYIRRTLKQETCETRAQGEIDLRT